MLLLFEWVWNREEVVGEGLSAPWGIFFLGTILMSKAVPAFPVESPRPDAGQLCWGRSASRGRVSDRHCHEPWSLGKRLSGRFFQGVPYVFFLPLLSLN